jgi:carbon storage regulator CsrA
MLVLSRKRGQSIVIADEIVVNVVEISRGRVQIGVSAPAHLSIYRQELVAKKGWTYVPNRHLELTLQTAAQPPQ